MGYFLEVNVQYIKEMHKLHKSHLTFLQERMKTGKVYNVLANLYDEKECVMDKNIKKTLNHELVLQKVHWVITLNPKGRLKPYIDMNTELTKKQMVLKNIISRWWSMKLLEKR